MQALAKGRQRAPPALLCVQLYRRGNGWKVRAVGQGYANGLAGIATDHGISVAADEPAAVPPRHGAGDDETITVDLQALPPTVDAVVFVVNSFRGQKFTEVRSAYCRLLDLDPGAELVRFDLSDSEPRTGVVMSVLRRSGSAWEMTAIGEFHDGKTVRAMYGPAEDVVRGLG